MHSYSFIERRGKIYPHTDVTDLIQTTSLQPNLSLGDSAVPDKNYPTNVTSILHQTEDCKLEQIIMYLTPFRILIEIQKMDTNANIRSMIKSS